MNNGNCVYCGQWLGSEWYTIHKAIKPKGHPYRKIKLKSKCCLDCGDIGCNLFYEFGEKCEVE